MIPHRVSNKADRRYEVQVVYPNGAVKVLGWHDDPDDGRLVKMAEQHPEYSKLEVKVVDLCPR